MTTTDTATTTGELRWAWRDWWGSTQRLWSAMRAALRPRRAPGFAVTAERDALRVERERTRQSVRMRVF